MHWTIEKFDSPLMFRVRLRGTFGVELFREMMDEVSAAKQGCQRCPVLFDDSDLNLNKVDIHDLAAAVNAFVRHNPDFAHSKVAIYMGARTDLDIVYQFKAVAESLSNAVIEIFQKESEAVRWLTAPSNGKAELAVS